MITELNIAGGADETAAMLGIESADEIRRNNLRLAEISPLAEAPATDLALKFARLKKALRRRSADIL